MIKYTKLDDSELNSFCLDYALFDDSPEGLAENYRVSPGSLHHFLTKGTRKNFITKEQRKEGRERRRQDKLIKNRRDKVIASTRDYVYFNDSVKDILENYSISRNTLVAYLKEAENGKIIPKEDADEARKRRMYGRGRITSEKLRTILEKINEEVDKHKEDNTYRLSTVQELAEAFDEKPANLNAQLCRRRENLEVGEMLKYRSKQVRKQASTRSGLKAKREKTGIHALPRSFFVEMGRKNGKKIADKNRRNKYHVEGRFHTSSLGEGAVALMLEEYIVNFGEIKEGENFQVRDKELDCGGIDFLLGDEFLEWHPPIANYDEKDRERGQMMQELRDQIKSPEDKKIFREFEKEYLDDLSIEYWEERQEKVNSSGYSGHELELIRNEREFYNFLERCSREGRLKKDLPSYTDFRKQFEEAQEKVRSDKVQPKKDAPERCAAGN